MNRLLINWHLIIFTEVETAVPSSSRGRYWGACEEVQQEKTCELRESFKSGVSYWIMFLKLKSSFFSDLENSVLWKLISIK